MLKHDARIKHRIGEVYHLNLKKVKTQKTSGKTFKLLISINALSRSTQGLMHLLGLSLSLAVHNKIRINKKMVMRGAGVRDEDK